MKQWEMGRSQTPLPLERRAEVPWLFIRRQTGTGVLVCCTIPTSSRPLSENDEADIKTAREIATRAKTRFPVGSPGWVKADDLASLKPPPNALRR